MNGNVADCRENSELVHMLQAELAETNREILALTLEMDRRVDEQTAELKAAQEELQRTNSELLQLTLELEERVARRTDELESKNQELRTMTQQLWQAAKLATMGELAASIAHELNNPLATVSLRLETIAAQTPGDDPRRRLLDVVTSEIDRMAALVANLLAFSRRGSQHISTVDVREEVDRTFELVSFTLKNRGIAVSSTHAPEIPYIHADRQQLRQLFLNLFQNAADAMPSGGILAIGITPSADHKKVVIDVKDTGTGIIPEHIARLSEPFFTTKPEGKGTGLGLSICRRIVAEHHGEMNIESIPGKGTTVRIMFPVHAGTNGTHLAVKEQ